MMSLLQDSTVRESSSYYSGTDDAVACLSNYLAQTETIDDIVYPRVRCPSCNASHPMYCCHCLHILADPHRWPDALRHARLRLPFGLDIVLNDRRVVSTGVQLATIFQSMELQQQRRDGTSASASSSTLSASEEENDVMLDRTGTGTHQQQQVRLFPPGKPIPAYKYNHNDDDDDDDDDEKCTTYLLFPSTSSIPLSQVISSSSSRSLRLVVLDCKWRQTSMILDRSLSKLPHVHLDDPPTQSFYWRWHNSGPSRLSTVEALYYASWQVGSSMSSLNWNADQLQQLCNMFWLFRHQRHTIQCKYNNSNTMKKSSDSNPNPNHAFTAPLPFTEEGKEYHRAFRRHKTSLA